MTTLDQTEAAPAVRTAEARRRKSSFASDWWRYLVGLLAIAFAVFPILYVISSAFNPVDSLGSTGVIPEDLTLDNFRAILSGSPGDEGTSEAAIDVPYKNWYVNMIFVSGTTALLSVFFGVIAAYAFARFRFKGRRMGMLSLLLIQMFPTFLAVVAIYLIVLRVGDIFPAVGLDTRVGLILVYLGGVLGVNTWLMKGFLDSIPDSLDESARVDGATPAQVFWAVILPLAAPVLAVVGLISVHLLDQRVHHRERPARLDRQVHDDRRSVQLHQRQVRAAVGDVLCGRDPRRDSRRHPLLLPAALLHRGRHRRREGLTGVGDAARTAAPRRLRALRAGAPRPSSATTSRCSCACRRRLARTPSRSATCATASRSRRVAEMDRETRVGRRGGARRSPVDNPATPYRWLLSGGASGTRG